MELWEDGYQGDVIGEYTQDVLVTEIIWRKGIMSLAEMKCSYAAHGGFLLLLTAKGTHMEEESVSTSEEKKLHPLFE
ncbi:hypothetical protein V6N11_010816 [Hibiscus sabdariffa]|uniref:Uncharacterized protein n=1 Tax=Hibiscus sabdariffa TaxID=183260 RepID=A0ABR2S6D1_9ROSI